MIGATVVPLEGERVSFRIGRTQLNVHGPGMDVSTNVARLPVRPGNSDVCFEWWGNIAEAIDHLRAHDEVVLGPVTRTGAKGSGTSVYFRDPDGSLLEFISYL